MAAYTGNQAKEPALQSHPLSSLRTPQQQPTEQQGYAAVKGIANVGRLKPFSQALAQGE